MVPNNLINYSVYSKLHLLKISCVRTHSSSAVVKYLPITVVVQVEQSMRCVCV